MRLRITRDSVAAGDDCDAPHEREIEINDNSTVIELAMLVQSLNYLAHIASGEATWILETDKPLAVIAQQWDMPKQVTSDKLVAKSLSKGEDLLAVHLSYHCQEDPDAVFRKLQKQHSEGAT